MGVTGSSLRPWAASALTLTMTGVFGLQATCAELPDLSLEQIADLVQKYESRITRLRATCEIVGGTVENSDLLHGAFTPQTPPFTATIDTAVDFTADTEYFHQTQLTQGKYDKTSCAFDGKLCTHLIGGAGDDRREGKASGKVTQGRTEELEGMSHHLRAAEAAYWPIPGRSLSDTIRRGARPGALPLGRRPSAGVEVEDVAGTHCYRVTVRIEQQATIEHGGQTLPAWTVTGLRVWLNPARNMLPLRIDFLLPTPDGGWSEPPLGTLLPSDFREVADGLWFPFACRRGRPGWPGASVMTVTKLLLNDDAVVPTRIDFPPGTSVRDEVLGTKYRAGGPASSLSGEWAVMTDSGDERTMTLVQSGSALTGVVDDGRVLGSVSGACVRVWLEGDPETVGTATVAGDAMTGTYECSLEDRAGGWRAARVSGPAEGK